MRSLPAALRAPVATQTQRPGEGWRRGGREQGQGAGGSGVAHVIGRWPSGREVLGMAQTLASLLMPDEEEAHAQGVTGCRRFRYGKCSRRWLGRN